MSRRGFLYGAVCVCLILVLAATAAQAQGYTFVTKWGSQGTGDGQFVRPSGVAADGSGNVYVADPVNKRIQKFDSDGSFLAKWGSYGTGNGQFRYPIDVAVDASGNVYVVEYLNHRIQKFASDGVFITKWGSYGTGDGQFKRPDGVAVDGSGNVYVADRMNHRSQKFDSDGNFLIKWGSYGSGDGQLRYPYSVAVDGSGNVYVADLANQRIQKFTSSGVFLTKWGSYGSGDGQFHKPLDVAVDAFGDVYVADSFNHRIQKFDSDGSFLIKWGSEGTGDGQFHETFGVAVDSSGNVYVVDYYNHRVQKFAPANHCPTAVAKANDQSGSVTVDEASPSGTEVTLDGSGSSDPNGDLLTYAWDFETDGIVDSTDAVTMGTYAVGGPYTATLTVTDPSSASDIDAVTVTVVPGDPDNQLENIGELIALSVASGDVADQLEKSLTAKVEGAMAALTRGKPGAIDSAIGKLEALINQVQAQSGKKIDPGTAEEIIERAERIIAELGPEPESLALGGEAMITNVSAVPTAAGVQIVFTTSADTVVSVEVLNIAGRSVRHIVTNRAVSAGVSSLSWNACNNSGLKVPSGMYLVRINTNATSGASSSALAPLNLQR